jgi:hypothetical protein
MSTVDCNYLLQNEWTAMYEVINIISGVQYQASKFGACTLSVLCAYLYQPSKTPIRIQSRVF